MKKIVLIFSVIMLTAVLANAQTVSVTGYQVKKGGNAELSCEPITIENNMKITQVKGNNGGFWIVKGSATIHSFTNMNDAVGTVLSPGTYYFYPNFDNKGRASTKASIEVILQ